MKYVINKTNKKDIITSAIIAVNAKKPFYVLDKQNGKIVVLVSINKNNKFVAHYDGQKTKFTWLLEAGETCSRDWGDLYDAQVNWVAKNMMRGW